tara:strand:+ start:123 stop:476 length:354 start_codon:yes stop_codon:yes gene_type:complete
MAEEKPDFDKLHEENQKRIVLARAKELEAKFQEITNANVGTLTSLYVNPFSNIKPHVFQKQLEILDERSRKLEGYIADYHLQCGKEHDTFYQTAIVTGTLARNKLVEIMNEVEKGSE